MRYWLKRTGSALTSGSNVPEAGRKRWKMNHAPTGPRHAWSSYFHDRASARNTCICTWSAADSGGTENRQGDSAYQPFRTTQANSRAKGETNAMRQRFHQRVTRIALSQWLMMARNNHRALWNTAVDGWKKAAMNIHKNGVWCWNCRNYAIICITKEKSWETPVLNINQITVNDQFPKFEIVTISRSDQWSLSGLQEHP